MAILNEGTTIGGGSPLISNSAGILKWGDNNSQGVCLGRNTVDAVKYFTDSVILGTNNIIQTTSLYGISVYGNENKINLTGEDYTGIYGDYNTNNGGAKNYVYGYNNIIQGGYENLVYGEYNEILSGNSNMILGSSIRITDDSAGTILIGSNFGVELAVGSIAIIANGNNGTFALNGVLIADQYGVAQAGYIRIVDDEVRLYGKVLINGTDISQLIQSMTISTPNELPSFEE